MSHVGAWLAYAAVVKTLVLGDGDVSLTRLRIAVKEEIAEELADALGSRTARDMVYLQPTIVRLLPPLLPTMFEKDRVLYRHLALFVRGLEVAIGERRWLLDNDGTVSGRFRIRGAKAAELAESLKGIFGEVTYVNDVLRLSESEALRLVKLGLARLLSEPEYEAARREVPKSVKEALKIAASLAKNVKIHNYRYKKRGKVYIYKYANLYFDDREKLEEALRVLRSVGINPTVDRDRIIRIYKYEYVEILRSVKIDDRTGSATFSDNCARYRYGGKGPPVSAAHLALIILISSSGFSAPSLASISAAFPGSISLASPSSYIVRGGTESLTTP